jgi:hypothetical protein
MLLSHQVELAGGRDTVGSRDRLMHLSLDRFMKLPPREAGTRGVGDEMRARTRTRVWGSS